MAITYNGRHCYTGIHHTQTTTAPATTAPATTATATWRRRTKRTVGVSCLAWGTVRGRKNNNKKNNNIKGGTNWGGVVGAAGPRDFVVFAVEVEALDELEMETMERMEKATEKLGENLQTIRTGRATPALLEGVMVDYYGAPTPIKSLASITVQDGANIVVQPFDKSCLGDVEKAVRDSDLGLSPTNDGSIVRINVPQLTEERRKEMVKVVSKFGEESKVAIRNIRRDCKKTIDKYQKDGLSEDLCKDKEQDIQTLTDDFVKKIDEAVKAKEKEITKV
ncbi:ribosome-recycling factor [Chloropicon primus]|uniref:Ribosome-recycling factor, chloroplastic n=2 Tax=Chloropicon primus TaxID=1764295 RepID=A0A5B8MUX8_9CHLO|nr:ribosome-recycling factor [Chloropicon primus]UPR02424.1 ribosome-recycling factor [Chloropicon primus]|eukprot:QDZ23210.1 ribosome-recycling factor [Chloropicon primus]